jgi:hypothetical protein
MSLLLVLGGLGPQLEKTPPMRPARMNSEIKRFLDDPPRP